MKILKYGFYLFFPLIVGSIVGMAISNYIDYNNLIKPSLSPPSIVFPIAWSIIYLLLGISYFIYRRYNNNEKLNFIYYLQLFVNAMWSIIFFIWKARLFSIFWILILLILVIYLIICFYHQNKTSAYLNILYIIWLLFATYLNIGIYLLN